MAFFAGAGKGEPKSIIDSKRRRIQCHSPAVGYDPHKADSACALCGHTAPTESLDMFLFKGGAIVFDDERASIIIDRQSYALGIRHPLHSVIALRGTTKDAEMSVEGF